MIVEVYFKRACVFVAPPRSPPPEEEEVSAERITENVISRIGRGEYRLSNYLANKVLYYYIFPF